MKAECSQLNVFARMSEKTRKNYGGQRGESTA